LPLDVTTLSTRKTAIRGVPLQHVLPDERCNERGAASVGSVARASPFHPILPRIGVSMDLNRNQFFFIGLVILLLGLQVRYVSAYVLNPEATKFLAERTGQSNSATGAFFTAMAGTPAAPRKVLHPPEWLSWCLISVGAVLCLHSLAMPKPG
jgi:hypothetical protein